MFVSLNASKRSARGFMTVLFLAGWGVACTPAMNWREVRFEGGDMVALMPCKPEEATRTVTLFLPAVVAKSGQAKFKPQPQSQPHADTPTPSQAGSAEPPGRDAPPEGESVTLQLSMKACKVLGQQFAFAKLSFPESQAQKSQALSDTKKQAITQAWQQASRASFEQVASPMTPAVPELVYKGEMIRARNAAGMQVQWLWRVKSGDWYQAGVYADSSQAFKAEDAQIYFESLQ
jgi:hypothetical protein